jgi:hypothetical protein
MVKEKFNREIYVAREKEENIAKDKLKRERNEFKGRNGGEDYKTWRERKKSENFIKGMFIEITGIGKNKFEKARDAYYKSEKKLREITDMGHKEAIELNKKFDDLESRCKRTAEQIKQLPENSSERELAEKEYQEILDELIDFKEKELA